MRRTLFALGGLVIAAAIAGPIVRADRPVHNPKIVMLDELVDRYKPVPFEHEAHAKMAEMWDGCETCHHKSPNGRPAADTPLADGRTRHTQDESDEIPACKSCHPVKPDKANIRLPSLKGAYHRQCLNCHKAWTGENNCVICHEARDGEAADAPAPTPGDVIGRMHPPIEAPDVKVFKARYVPATGPLVTFRHTEHVEQFGISCVACHQRDTCGSCHDPEQQGEARKPVNPATSWKQSHQPCLACHNNQSCSHCHHENEADAPPPFQHEMTGQLLDDDHADLECVQCHTDRRFTAQPTCGDGQCHGEDRIALPDDRPGRRIRPTLPHVLHRKIVTDRPARLGGPRAAQTGATDTIADEPTALAVRRAAPRMTSIDRPTTPRETCVTAECHAAVKSYNTLHGPVAADACEVCHKLTDEQNHRFTVVRQREELCTYCHAFSVEALPVVHSPTERGECLGCHNPHGGRDRSMTREDSTEALCNRCHESLTVHKAFLHSPVAEGDCVSCHPPHASRFPKLLDAAGPDLCLACHDEFGEQLATVKFVHEAMDEGCAACHDPHGGSFANALSAPAPTLCLNCHEQTARQIEQASVAHSPVSEGRSCLTCHTSHGGNVIGLMRDRSALVCMDCHDEKITVGDDRTIPAVEHVLDEQYVKHGPIAEGACRGCHTPHGGTRPDLLAGTYTDERRIRFDPEQFGLCFECHDARLATVDVFNEDIEPTTGFRNGPTNLHALHVNQKWGRSCRVCHATHASRGRRLVRETVTFGQWDAPLGFEATDTGGRCGASCHLPFSYDRQDPIDLPSQRELAEQALRVRANPDMLESLQWRGEDTAGRPVTIPHEQRATLLLIVRADGETDAEAVREIRRRTPGLDRAQVVLLVEGDPGDRRLGAIREAAGPGWRIIRPTPEQAPDVDAHASPLALVIADDGRVLKRVGGTPRLLSFTVSTYLDLAAGRATPDADRVVNGHEEDPRFGVEPVQYLRAAQRLIDRGEFARAEKTLREAIALHPRAVALQEAMVRVLIDLHRAGDALELLDRLPAEAIDAASRMLLTARAQIALARWDAAKQSLDAALETAPGRREAHFLMGLVHQQAGDWQAAAESFRAAHEAKGRQPSP